MPAAIASSTAYWISGLSTTGNISFGLALVAGKKRVPRPATGNTALVTFSIFQILAVMIELQEFMQADAPTVRAAWRASFQTPRGACVPARQQLRARGQRSFRCRAWPEPL